MTFEPKHAGLEILMWSEYPIDIAHLVLERLVTPIKN